MWSAWHGAPERISHARVAKEVAMVLGSAALGARVSLLKGGSQQGGKIEWYDTRTDNRLRAGHRKIALGLLEREPELDASLRALYAAAAYWHGTGRYYETVGGSHADVLKGILETGGLKPTLDTADHRSGTMESVSIALSRMYARTYAEAHATKGTQKRSYGSVSFWLGSFAGSIMVDMAKQGTLTDFLSYSVRHTADPSKRARHTQKESVMSPRQALEGSAVAGNYPLLIGIRNEIKTRPKYGQSHERRALDIVPIASFTHLEVPLENIEITRALLAEYEQSDLPVLPIEAGEEYAARFRFSQLTSGERLV